MTTLQKLVKDFLVEQRAIEFKAPEGLGSFVYPEPAGEDSGCEDNRIVTRRVVDDDDDDVSEVSNNPETLTAECEAALKTIVWSKDTWLTRLVCPLDIVGRVVGRDHAFLEELSIAYPGLRIQLNHSFAPPQSSYVTAADIVTGTSKKATIKERANALWMEMTHIDDKVKLAKARVELDDRIRSFMSHAAYTHFLSLPILDSDNLEFPERHRIFRNELDAIGIPGISSELAQAAERSHFTLLMLRLYSDDDVQAVVNVLKRVAKKPSSHRILFTDDIPPEKPKNVDLPPKGLHVKLRGLYVMDEDPASARVVYTKEDTSRDKLPVTLETQEKFKVHGWLYLRRPAETYIDSLIEDIVTEMLQAGIIDAQELVQDRLISSTGAIKRKLHVTILNTKFTKSKQPINALPLLENPFFSEYDFGTAVITGLHISRRGESSFGTHYYVPEFVLPIRPNLGL